MIDVRKLAIPVRRFAPDVFFFRLRIVTRSRSGEFSNTHLCLLALPREHTPAMLPEITNPLRGGVVMAKILIVEDYRDTRDVTAFILADTGYTVSLARDGLEGMQRATQEHPDLILMDLALPRLDGWEATRRLKAHPATCHIPVVAFTAQIDHEALSEATDAGCVAI